MLSRVIPICLAVALTAGCSSGSADNVSYAPVTGVAMLDGKPLEEGATITFVPKGKGSMSMGLTDANGRFSLKTATGKNGAAVGEHDVSVIHSITLGGPTIVGKVEDLAAPNPGETGYEQYVGASAKPTTRWIVPEKYSKPGALKATVPSGGLSDHKIDLTSK